METITLFGADYSVYTRIVKLVLLEMNMPYKMQEVDIFSSNVDTSEYVSLNPFRKIPAVRCNDFILYETDAIVTYLLKKAGKDLKPLDLEGLARCHQILRIADNHVFPVLVQQLYVDCHLDGVPPNSLLKDEVKTIVTELDKLNAFQIHDREKMSLKDIWLAPMFDYFLMTDLGETVLEENSAFKTWWDWVTRQPSIRQTSFVDEKV